MSFGKITSELAECRHVGGAQTSRSAYTDGPSVGSRRATPLVASSCLAAERSIDELLDAVVAESVRPAALHRERVAIAAGLVESR
jgi:hypothetical protein